MNKEHSSASATNDDQEATTAAPRRIETPVPSSGVVVRSDGVSTGQRLQPPRPRPRSQASAPPPAPSKDPIPTATPAIPEGDGPLEEVQGAAPSQSTEVPAEPAAPQVVVAAPSGGSRKRWGGLLGKVVLVGCLASASVGAAVLLLARHQEGGAASSGQGVITLRKVDEIARVLRDRGLAECERQAWKDCAADLDEATTRDPEIGEDPRVQGALSTAQQHVREEQTP